MLCRTFLKWWCLSTTFTVHYMSSKWRFSEHYIKNLSLSECNKNCSNKSYECTNSNCEELHDNQFNCLTTPLDTLLGILRYSGSAEVYSISWECSVMNHDVAIKTHVGQELFISLLHFLLLMLTVLFTKLPISQLPVASPVQLLWNGKMSIGHEFELQCNSQCHQIACDHTEQSLESVLYRSSHSQPMDIFPFNRNYTR